MTLFGELPALPHPYMESQWKSESKSNVVELPFFFVLFDVKENYEKVK